MKYSVTLRYARILSEMFNTKKMTTSRMAVLILIACLSSKANGQVTGNTLFLAHYSYHNFGTYIGWLPASPESYKNNQTLDYRKWYFSNVHYWNSIAADYHAGNVTFHDTRNHWIYLSDDFEAPGGGVAHPIESGTSGRVLGMTIDWLAQNVYWVDEGYNWIKMTNYLRGGREATIVDTGLERPSGIACHPIKGYLFWTELGNTYPPKIERSSMAGANRTTIVTGLSDPRSIAVDIITNRIYWIDNSVAESKVESSDLNGDGRRTEVSQPSSDGVFDSISVDEDYIFVSIYSLTYEHILRYYSKSTTPSGIVFQYIFSSGIRVLDLCVTGPNIQPRPTTLPCDVHTCSHLCVSAAEGKHECVCSDNYVLYPNGTCSIDLNFLYPPLCVIGRAEAISVFNPSLLHAGVDGKQEYIHDFLSRTDDIITAVAVDTHSNFLFYAEDTRKSIFVVRLEDDQYPRIIHTYTGGRVDGMAVDWISLKVYWVDYLQDRLRVSSYDGMSTSVMFYNVDSPRALAVDSNARLIFWTEQSSPTKLVSCNLDGTNRHDLVNTNLLNPSGIALDHAQRRVYIVGEDSIFIYSVDYDGIEQVNIIGISTYPAKDITIFQDFIILAESNVLQPGLIEAIHKISGSHEGRIKVNTTVYAIDTFDESTQPIATPTTTLTITTTSPLSTTTQTTATTTPTITTTSPLSTTTQTTATTTPTITTTSPLSTTKQTTATTTPTITTTSPLSTTKQTTATTTPTITTTSPLSTTKQTTATTTPTITNTSPFSTATQTTGHATSVGANATQEMQSGNDYIVIIGGAFGSIALIVIILLIIIIVLIKERKRPQEPRDSQGLASNIADHYATHLPQAHSGQDNHIYESPYDLKPEPPTYESSIRTYGRNQATGESPYVVTKLDHQFDNPNTVALYSKSESVPVAVNTYPYVQHGFLPPQYAPEVQTDILK
ncbi:low-density lipoprotein receptor-related protein 4-like isoform X4 [Anneissia japonica]|uniref:low-density lipoprotein receptor-related protein 4-like isoform X4 n=1 Tax=Anneissia japonica TaxID=1529436 RepID=UPI001425A45E|nr:low-density lipoprotein receptor-related protein 4-like isoform X4 [Anneissia japonica]